MVLQRGERMNDKLAEFIGVILAATGFSMLATGVYEVGFLIGLGSCAILMPYFFIKKQNFLLLLQGYFAIMNLVGLFNNI